jgi:hypothetical protein
MHAQTFDAIAQRSMPWDLLATLSRQDPDTARQPVVRVSRLEAMLADVFEKGLTTAKPRYVG